MNFLSRGLTSIKRRPTKTFILWALVFILGNIISGAISIREAVIRTDSNIWGRLSAVAVLEEDVTGQHEYFERYGVVERTGILTSELLREVGNLDYVRYFSYSLDFHMFHPALQRYFNVFYTNEAERALADTVIDVTQYFSQGAEFQQFNLRGVSHPEFSEIKTGRIELISGRLMTETEIKTGAPVVLISRGLAQYNNLEIGSQFDFVYAWFDMEAEVENWGEQFREEHLQKRVDIPLTVIGIFDLDGVLMGDDIIEVNHNKLLMENRLYLPNSFIKEAIQTEHLARLAFQDGHSEAYFDSLFLWNAMFYLESPLYLASFSQLANEILPQWRIIRDLSYTFGDFVPALENLLWIADLILYVAIGATILILSLLIMLFLRDRKQEIGIYLALGEKAIRIMGQIWTETFLPAINALIIALFTGSLFASSLSSRMLENDLASRYDTFRPDIRTLGMNELMVFNPTEMNLDEMLAAYDITLQVSTTLSILGIASLVILVSTIFPLIYVFRLSPKRILL